MLTEQVHSHLRQCHKKQRAMQQSIHSLHLSPPPPLLLVLCWSFQRAQKQGARFGCFLFCFFGNTHVLKEHHNLNFKLVSWETCTTVGLWRNTTVALFYFVKEFWKIPDQFAMAVARTNSAKIDQPILKAIFPQVRLNKDLTRKNKKKALVFKYECHGNLSVWHDVM